MSEIQLTAVLEKLCGEKLHTPTRRMLFTVSRIENGRVTVTTSNANDIHLSLTSIQAVLDYHDRHGHGRERPCPVKSSNRLAESGCPEGYLRLLLAGRRRSGQYGKLPK